MTFKETLAELAAAVDLDRPDGPRWWPGNEMAAIVIRRWASFERRNKSKVPTDEQRIKDLAKGLKSRFDPLNHDPESEFIRLASILAEILRRNQYDPRPPA